MLGLGRAAFVLACRHGPSTSATRGVYTAFRLQCQAGAKHAVPRKGRMWELRRLLALARPVRGRLAVAVGLLGLSSGVTLSVPFFMGRIMDSFLSPADAQERRLGFPALDDAAAKLNALMPLPEKEEDPSSGGGEESRAEIMRQLGSFCVVLGVVFFVGAAANFGRTYIMITAGQKVTNRLRTSVYSSILRQDMAFFDKAKTGELVNRLSNDVSLVGASVTMNISDGLRSLASATGGTAMMMYVSPSLAVVGLSIVPPVAAVAIVYGRYIRRLIQRYNDALAAATQVAEERISGIRTVRAFAAEDLEARSYGERIDAIMGLARRDAVLRALFFGFAGLSGNAVLLSILYAGGYFVTSGALSLGQLSAFLLYAAYVGISIGGLSGFYSELMRGLGASTRLFELIDRRPTIPLRGGLSPAALRGELRFRGVHFAFPERADVEVLKGLDLHVPPGSVTAVVGPSGSGKSTLFALLLRFYDPSQGHIEVDGEDLAKLDPSWVRRHLGTVAQDPLLFSASIADNIAYGLPPGEATRERVEWAAEQANALGFIRSFPRGLDTLVGEKGLMLSGGQRQRIAIARALVSEPSVLLLDEATSALDAESEAAVKVALDALLRDHRRTILLIAHRLSTVRNAEQIAVISDGRVAELGDFASLQARTDGIFRRLVQKQTLSDH